MADTTIINEQERTGVLPYEEMMAKASATIAIPMPAMGVGADFSDIDNASTAPAGPQHASGDSTPGLDLAGDILSTFYTPTRSMAVTDSPVIATAVASAASSRSDATPGMNIIEDILSAFYTQPTSKKHKNAMPLPRISGPFKPVTRSLAPFTVMSPQIDLNDVMAPKYPKPGQGQITAKQWVSGRTFPSGGIGRKKSPLDRGQLSIFMAYDGGLKDIRGASMPGMMVTPSGSIRLRMAMLDPKLVEALRRERERQLEPSIVPGAKKLSAEDYRQLVKHNNPAHRQQLGI